MSLLIKKNNKIISNDLDDILNKNSTFKKGTLQTSLSYKKPAYGFIWVKLLEYDETFDYSMLIKNASNQKTVYQYNKELSYIGEYKGLVNAQEKTGVKADFISACCNGWQKTAGGFIWSYKKLN